MTDTKLGQAFENYVETYMVMIRWIMSITLVEIAFIFTQRYHNNIFFSLHIFGIIWCVISYIGVNYVLYN